MGRIGAVALACVVVVVIAWWSERRVELQALEAAPICDDARAAHGKRLVREALKENEASRRRALERNKLAPIVVNWRGAPVPVPAVPVAGGEARAPASTQPAPVSASFCERRPGEGVAPADGAVWVIPSDDRASRDLMLAVDAAGALVHVVEEPLAVASIESYQCGCGPPRPPPPSPIPPHPGELRFYSSLVFAGTRRVPYDVTAIVEVYAEGKCAPPDRNGPRPP